VWDSGSGGGPGRQLLQCLHGSVTTLTSDPTGTATNPAVDFYGLRVAFESTADLAGTGNPPGVRQVFVRQLNGTIEQMSMGVGTSRNPVISGKKHRLAFESTSDPTTGADTGTSQIWLGDLLHGGAERITAGFGPSRNPALSDDGNLLVFESTADLAGTLADTGVSQIFCYDPKSATFARITDDAGGCTLPSAGKFKGDWRVTFVCGGVPQFYMLREDQRYEVATGGGVTERVISEMGIHFVVLSTTANLLGSGTTAGKQVYLVNLFKRPGVPIPGLATWFPSRGIPPF
jgi:WD40-like Beta Propeller Repeat